MGSLDVTMEDSGHLSHESSMLKAQDSHHLGSEEDLCSLDVTEVRLTSSHLFKVYLNQFLDSKNKKQQTHLVVHSKAEIILRGSGGAACPWFIKITIIHIVGITVWSPCIKRIMQLFWCKFHVVSTGVNIFKVPYGDFPGSPSGEDLTFLCRECGFNLQLGS